MPAARVMLYDIVCIYVRCASRMQSAKRPKEDQRRRGGAETRAYAFAAANMYDLHVYRLCYIILRGCRTRTYGRKRYAHDRDVSDVVCDRVVKRRAGV